MVAAQLRQQPPHPDAAPRATMHAVPGHRRNVGCSSIRSCRVRAMRRHLCVPPSGSVICTLWSGEQAWRHPKVPFRWNLLLARQAPRCRGPVVVCGRPFGCHRSLRWLGSSFMVIKSAGLARRSVGARRYRPVMPMDHLAGQDGIARRRVIVSVTATADGRVTLSRMERLLDDGPKLRWKATWPPDVGDLLTRRAAAIEERHHPTVVLEGSGTFVADEAGSLHLPDTGIGGRRRAQRRPPAARPGR
jgi:hypothetical protein